MKTSPRQDLNRGQGFCLIDPHGELAEALADHPDVLCWRVADPGSQLGYNPLQGISASRRHLVASGLIEALRKQWADAWGPRMEHLLRYAVLALLEQPQADLRDVMRMFLESDFRKQAIPRISDPLVHAFWSKEYPAMNYRTSADGVAPLANKLGALLSNPVVRKALCAPDQPLRFRKLMDAQQSLVINLSKGQLGADTANVMGGLLLASLVNAAFSRADTEAANRTPFILYVDEFHHFSTGVFADALSECRKYGLGAVLAQQYTTQTDRDVLEAIFGNVGTILALTGRRAGCADDLKTAPGRVPRTADPAAKLSRLCANDPAGSETDPVLRRPAPAAPETSSGPRREIPEQYPLRMTDEERLQAHFDLCERIYLRLLAAGEWPFEAPKDSSESDSCDRVQSIDPSPMKPCFGYIRVSTLRQGEGVSLQEQKDAIIACAALRNLQIIEWFEELETAAKSGRPIFNRMIARLRKGHAQGFVVHKIDRSARNLKDWALVSELPDEGIDVHIATESLGFQHAGWSNDGRLPCRDCRRFYPQPTGGNQKRAEWTPQTGSLSLQSAFGVSGHGAWAAEGALPDQSAADQGALSALSLRSAFSSQSACGDAATGIDGIFRKTREPAWHRKNSQQHLLSWSHYHHADR